MQNILSNDFKRFFKRAIILLFLLIIIDFLTGSLLKHYYFKQKSGLHYFTTYAIDSTKADILIFGSSRANHHYVPAIFENKFHSTFFNCGRDGCSIIYYAAVASAVLERYTPKRIIIDITPNDLYLSEENKLAPLLPYHDNPAISPFIKYNSKFENLKLLSKMYPYNSLLTNILANLHTHSQANDGKGYLKLDKLMGYHPMKKFKYEEIISIKVKILDDLLNKLNKKNIPVDVVISPSYFLFIGDNPNSKTVEGLCKKYSNISFFNYENDPAFVNYTLYYDDFHLNHIGAEKFSKDLSDKIK